MSIPTRVWTVGYSPWGLFPGLSILKPLTDPALKDPVGKEEADYASEEKEPVEDCFWHVCLVNL